MLVGFHSSTLFDCHVFETADFIFVSLTFWVLRIKLRIAAMLQA